MKHLISRLLEAIPPERGGLLVRTLASLWLLAALTILGCSFWWVYTLAHEPGQSWTSPGTVLIWTVASFFILGLILAAGNALLWFLSTALYMLRWLRHGTSLLHDGSSSTEADLSNPSRPDSAQPSGGRG